MPLSKQIIALPGKDRERGTESETFNRHLALLGVRMFAHTRNVLAGAARNLAQAEWKIQVGPQSITTSPGGTATITFPLAFPRAVVYVGAQEIDSMQHSTAIDNVTLTSFDLITSKNNTTFTLEWWALGY